MVNQDAKRYHYLGNFFPIILRKSKKIWDKKNLAGSCGFLAQARDKEGIYMSSIYIYIYMYYFVTVYTLYAYYIGKVGIHWLFSFLRTSSLV